MFDVELPEKGDHGILVYQPVVVVSELEPLFVVARRHPDKGWMVGGLEWVVGGLDGPER